MKSKYDYGLSSGSDPLLADTPYAKPEPQQPARSVSEIGSFITMLRAACEDRGINERLEKLLSLPDDKRQAVVHAWVSDMLIAQAPKDFIAAIACLLDNQVAEKAYEVIYQCKRG
jgi:hypothetical protein